MTLEEKLAFYATHNKNLLIIGNHGTGKTTLVKQTFEEMGLKWLYFSASTLDVWVDFVGIPEKKEENGLTYLDLVRPKCFADDSVEAIFIDEYNRAPEKVQNATMEFIQFRSINGKPFKNLKMVWAAINPYSDDDDLSYNVKKLDPAQIDRFHAKINFPNDPSKIFFTEKFGVQIGEAAINWWNSQGENVKKLVSPRNLDYAMENYILGGDLRDCLPKESNIAALIKFLKAGHPLVKFNEIFRNRDEKAVKNFLRFQSNIDDIFPEVIKDEEKIKFVFPFISEEYISSKYATIESKLLDKYVVENKELLKHILKSHSGTQNPILKKKFSTLIRTEDKTIL